MNRNAKTILSVLLSLLLAFLLLATASCGLFPEQNARPDGSAVYEVGADTHRLASSKGADSLEILVSKFMDCVRSDCDYGKIKDVYDPVAYLAVRLIDDLYDDRDLSFSQQREKAALLFGTAEELEQKDPELYRLVYEDLDVMEPEEAVNEYMTELRDSIRNGNFGPDDPGYEEQVKVLADWDKGADYVLEHYPDLFSGFHILIGMDQALQFCRDYAFLNRYNQDLLVFKDLEVSFNPANIYVRDSGICTYDMGNIPRGNDVYMLDLVYYYEEGKYFIIGYEITVGSMGG